MSIKINYSNKANSKSLANLVLFADEKFSINALKKNLSNLEFSYINDLLKTSDLKKNLFVFELNSKKKIVLVSIKKNIKTSDIENELISTFKISCSRAPARFICEDEVCHCLSFQCMGIPHLFSF